MGNKPKTQTPHLALRNTFCLSLSAIFPLLYQRYCIDRDLNPFSDSEHLDFLHLPFSHGIWTIIWMTGDPVSKEICFILIFFPQYSWMEALNGRDLLSSCRSWFQQHGREEEEKKNSHMWNRSWLRLAWLIKPLFWYQLTPTRFSSFC